MSERHAQVTLFIIVGIVVLVSVVMLFLYARAAQPGLPYVDTFPEASIQGIEHAFLSCEKTHAAEAVSLAEQQLGALGSSVQYTTLLGTSVPILHTAAGSHLPSHTTIAEDIGTYLLAVSDTCIAHITEIAARNGYTIEHIQTDIAVDVIGDTAHITVTPNTHVHIGTQRHTLPTSSTTHTITISQRLAMVERILANVGPDGSVPLSLLADMVFDEGIDVDMLDLGDVLVIILTDEHGTFMFGIERGGTP